MRQAITRAIADQGRTIRIPVHLVESINRVKKTAGELLRCNGREPTAEEIAVRLEMTPERVRELMQLAQEPISLETPVGKKRMRTWRILSRTNRQASLWTKQAVSCCAGNCFAC